MRRREVLISLGLGLGLTLATALVLGGRGEQVILAQAGSGVIRVATIGSDGPGCGSIASPCRTVQFAVDQALPGDEIRVAGGVYTDVHSRGGVTQVVYISSKGVTIRGGYATANWSQSNPRSNPTTLDARGQGRVFLVTDTLGVTLQGLEITGGDATGLGPNAGYDYGGGVYVHWNCWATTISGCTIISNTASTALDGYGGGVYAYADARLVGNTIVGNRGSTGGGGYGGGLYLSSPFGTIEGNTIRGNTASTASGGGGGGLYLSHGHGVLSGNAIIDNNASSAGAGAGGGLCTYDSDATFSGNTFRGNVASTDDEGLGGGLFLGPQSDATLINNAVVDNQANTAGSSLYITDASPRLLHTTLARTGPVGVRAGDGSDGSGIWVTNFYGVSTVAMTNTIIAGHRVGITVTGGNTVTLNGTLWHANDADRGGAGMIVHTNDHTGDPELAPFGYHLSTGSAAVDKGVNAGVTNDIDGDVRPWGAGYDIGADEFVMRHVFLPLVARDR